MAERFFLRLRQLRLRDGLTQAQLAQMLHKAESTIRMWELGKNQPDYDSLTTLAQIFGVSVDYMLGQSDFRPPAEPPREDAAVAAIYERPALRKLLEAVYEAGDAELEQLLRVALALKQN